MNFIHIAAFTLILSFSLSLVPTIMGVGNVIQFSDGNAMGDIVDEIGDESYPLTTTAPGQRGESIGQGDFLGGFNFFTVLTNVALPSTLFLELSRCGTLCIQSGEYGLMVVSMSYLFAGIIYFIYGMAIIQIISGRHFKSME